MKNVDGNKILLTADQALMTDFGGISFFGYGHCVPYRLVPGPFLKRFLGSPLETDGQGRARIATYPLRKVEAALLNAGFEKKRVIVTTPSKVRRTITEDTRVVGLSVVDPLGKSPVSYTLASLLGGGDSCTKVEFLTLMKEVKALKKEYNFKLIVGGQGVWQLLPIQKALGVDTLFFGEAEVTFPQLVRSIINGEKTPSIVYGETPSVDEIPAIVNPSRSGVVQVTRGCPRRCQFCSPTTLEFRSVPLEKILVEVEVNVKNGAKHVDLTSDDILLYGANGIRVNHEAVIELFRAVTGKYNTSVTFPHVSVATVRQDPSLVKEISEIAGFDFEHSIFPDVGLESGSPRIIAKYMSGKPRPWKPQEWSETVLEATRIMNENQWYPCYTMIVGFPDEQEDDIVKSIELVDELRNMKAMAWIFPLLSIPISNTPLAKQGYPSLEAMPKAVWELFSISWQQSLWFSQKVRDQLLSGISPLYRKVANRLFDVGIESLNKFFVQMQGDPHTALSRGMKLDFHSINGMITLVRELPKYLLRTAK